VEGEVGREMGGVGRYVMFTDARGGNRWLMLSAAIRGVEEFGWYANWSYCKRISILDDVGGVRIVGTGELVRDWRDGAAMNATGYGVSGR